MRTVAAEAEGAPSVAAVIPIPNPMPHSTSASPANRKIATGENDHSRYFHTIRRQKPRHIDQSSRRLARNIRMPERSSPYLAGTGTSLPGASMMFRYVSRSHSNE